MGNLVGAYLPADIFARYHRLAGNHVLMVSGSDSHGTPVTVRADAEGVTSQAVYERYPRLHGGFIWEWRDHGIRTKAADGTPFYAYGGDFGEVVHDGNFVMDGMVLSDDVPTPGLYEYKVVVQPLRFDLSPDRVEIQNRRHSADTADLVFRWVVAHDGRTVSSGNLAVPIIEAGSSARVPLPRSQPTMFSAQTPSIAASMMALPTSRNQVRSSEPSRRPKWTVAIPPLAISP